MIYIDLSWAFNREKDKKPNDVSKLDVQTFVPTIISEAFATIIV